MRARFLPARGFTTTELMVVLAIMGILAALAAPGMGAMMRTQRLKTAAFDVYSVLNFARSEAIKRNASVTITPVSGDWVNGWNVTDANGTLLKAQSAYSNITMAGPASMGFTGSGRASAIGNVSITSSDGDATKYRCVRLDASGRAIAQEGAC